MSKQKKWIRPEEIEAHSMEIIGREMAEGTWTPEELAVVKRCIHTSADFDYAENLYFSDGAAGRAIRLLQQGGVTIVTDTNMAAAGINRRALEHCHSTVRCFMAEELVAAEAKNRGVTRAVVSMEHAARLAGPVIFAIGNAPTALIRLCDMVEDGMLTPDFVIGVPVGFVNVVEAKERLIASGIPCIAARGRKGGSNIAAAIVNALMYWAVGR